MTQPLLQNWFLKDTLLWSVNELAANDLFEPRHSRFLASFRQKDQINGISSRTILRGSNDGIGLEIPLIWYFLTKTQGSRILAGFQQVFAYNIIDEPNSMFILESIGFTLKQLLKKHWKMEITQLRTPLPKLPFD